MGLKSLSRRFLKVSSSIVRRADSSIVVIAQFFFTRAENKKEEMLSTVKVKGLEIKPPKGSAFAYETAPNLPKLHQACLVVGPRGAGKTTAAINLIERLPFDRIFVISPTMRSNAELMKRLKMDPNDVYPDPDDIAALDAIKGAIEKEAEDLDRYHEEMKRYSKLMKLIHSQSPLFRLPDEDLAMFYRGGDFKPPEHKWNGRKPCCCLLIDDALGSGIYTKGIKKLNNMTILHRHIGQLKTGGAIGLSLFFLLQSYKAQAGGISRPIRHQATSLIVFSLKDQKQLAEIAEECSGEISPETFLKVYEKAIQGKHDFLFVDLHPKSNHPSGFRRNLDEFIVTCK